MASVTQGPLPTRNSGLPSPLMRAPPQAWPGALAASVTLSSLLSGAATVTVRAGLGAATPSLAARAAGVTAATLESAAAPVDDDARYSVEGLVDLRPLLGLAAPGGVAVG